MPPGASISLTRHDFTAATLPRRAASRHPGAAVHSRTCRRRRPARARADRDELLPRPRRRGGAGGGRRRPERHPRPRSASSSPRAAHAASRSSSRTATSTTSSASPTSPRGPARPSTRRRASARCSRIPPASRRRASPLRACTPDVLLEGGETLELAGITFDVRRRPGPLAGAPRLRDRRRRCSPATCSSPGSVGRTDLPGGDWETLLASIRTLVDRLPAGDRRPPGPRPGDDARRRARGNPFLAELRLESPDPTG